MPVPALRDLHYRTQRVLRFLVTVPIATDDALALLISPADDPITAKNVQQSLRRWAQRDLIRVLSVHQVSRASATPQTAATRTSYIQLGSAGRKVMAHSGFWPRDRDVPGASKMATLALQSRYLAGLLTEARHNGGVLGISWQPDRSTGPAPRPDAELGVSVLQRGAVADGPLPELLDLPGHPATPQTQVLQARYLLEFDGVVERRDGLARRMEQWTKHYAATALQQGGTWWTPIWITLGNTRRMETLWALWTEVVNQPCWFAPISALWATPDVLAPYGPRYCDEHGRTRTLDPWDATETRLRSIRYTPPRYGSLAAAIAANSAVQEGGQEHRGGGSTVASGAPRSAMAASISASIAASSRSGLASSRSGLSRSGLDIEGMESP